IPTNVDTSKYSFDENGELWLYSDADFQLKQSSTGYTLALTYFNNPSGLKQIQGTAFAETISSGDPVAYVAPGGDAGSLSPRRIEQSNVFYLRESIYAVELQRAMSGNLNMLRIASDIISNFINKLT
ncbi:MAG: flagellar basal body rod C-terminal domain-containing protein, partial [bacterium]